MGRHRHALPTGRRELERAYRALVAQAAAQRAETAQARLEVTRLIALTEGLTGLVTRLSGELSDARRELDRRPDDGHAALLAAQVEDLRSTVRMQEDLLSDLTRSVTEALAFRHEAVAAAPTAPPAAPTEAALPPAAPTEAALPEAPLAPGAEPVTVPVPVPATIELPAPAEPVLVLPAALEHAHALASAEPPGPGPVEDETVLRLRVIRQAFEA